MPNLIHFDEIMRIYDVRQANNRRIEKERYAEVCERIPGFEQLDSSMSDIDSDTLCALVSGDKSAASKFKDHIKVTDEKKKKLLTMNGFPADYLDHVYECYDCRDTGYINNSLCHCYKKELLNILYSQSNLKNAVTVNNFSNFNIEYYPDDYISPDNNITPRDNILKILNICKDFIENFKSSTADNLLIYGPSGVGKTFLSYCIAKELLDKGYSVIYLTSFQLFDILETKVFHKDELDKTATDIVSMLKQCDLLIIDDLGTEMINKFTEVQLFTCISERLQNNLSTIISTNLSFNEINAVYSERIFSRLTGYYKLVKITGDDIRIKKAVQSIEE